jgi:hypothetical protein
LKLQFWPSSENGGYYSNFNGKNLLTHVKQPGKKKRTLFNEQCPGALGKTLKVAEQGQKDHSKRTCLVKCETTKTIHVIDIHPYDITRYTFLSECSGNLQK